MYCLANTASFNVDKLQWFGNIVTMDWWDDLWLNEGFASYFEYIGVNVAEPGWEMVIISGLWRVGGSGGSILKGCKN